MLNLLQRLQILKVFQNITNSRQVVFFCLNIVMTVYSPRSLASASTDSEMLGAPHAGKPQNITNSTTDGIF